MIETAIVAPFLAVTLTGLIDVSMYGSTKLKVQQGINSGLEMAMMGGPNFSTSLIQSQAASQANVATNAVTVTQSLTCAGTTTTWSLTCPSGQETARYVQIQISTTYTPTFTQGVLRRLVNDNGVVPISTTGVIRVQ